MMKTSQIQDTKYPTKNTDDADQIDE
jgi:hypothetical protein